MKVIPPNKKQNSFPIESHSPNCTNLEARFFFLRWGIALEVCACEGAEMGGKKVRLIQMPPLPYYV